MSKFELDGEKIWNTLSSSTGLIASAFIAGVVEASSVQYSETGLVESAKDVSADLGDTERDVGPGGFVVAAGIFSTTAGPTTVEPEPNTLIYFRQDKKKNYSSVEKKAKKIYDAYNDKHVKEKSEGTSLITENSEVASVVNDIINSSKTKYELLSGLDSIESILEENEQEKQKRISLK